MDCEQVLEHPILAEQISAWGRSTSRMRTGLQLSNGRASGLVDVLDRVLDKGIVIDAWVRVSLVGIDLITVEARVVVASIETYLKYSEAVGSLTSASRPAIDSQGSESVIAENAALRVEIARTRREATAPRRLRRP